MRCIMGDMQVAYYETMNLKQFYSLFFMPVFSTFKIVKYPRLITDAHFTQYSPAHSHVMHPYLFLARP